MNRPVPRLVGLAGILRFAMRPFVAFLAFLGIVASASSQIKVVVNSEPVSFPGQGPAMVRGRILVPLRGVMEKIGAHVGWDNATQTVTAQTGTRDVRIRIGQEFAVVNGAQVRLDQPAIVMKGTTMVPLRFMGEALGADVTWDGATSTVLLNTKGGAVSGEAKGQITKFEFTPPGWATVNGQIQVTMNAPAGGQAKFSIPGVVEEFGMSEVTAGVYKGSFTVPDPSIKVLQVDGAPVIGIFQAGAAREVKQAARGARIDNVKPVISSPTPKNQANINELRPSVSVLLADQSGSGVNTSGVKVTVDGKDVTSNATVTEDFVAYRPAVDLTKGKHNASVSVRDIAGNVQTLSWSFTVSDKPSLIKSFSHNGLRALKPGDVVQFNVEAQTKGKAVVTLVTNKRTFALTEVSAGKYSGEYTVRSDDTITGETAVVTFTAANGLASDLESPRKVGSGSVSAFGAPTVSSPKSGTKVSSPLTVTGTAPGAASVTIKVTYRTVLAGNFPIGGTLYQGTAKTEANGRFEAKDIDIQIQLKGSDTTYTIEVIGISAAGKKSKATTVIVSG